MTFHYHAEDQRYPHSLSAAWQHSWQCDALCDIVSREWGCHQIEGFMSQPRPLILITIPCSPMSPLLWSGVRHNNGWDICWPNAFNATPVTSHFTLWIPSEKFWVWLFALDCFGLSTHSLSNPGKIKTYLILTDSAIRKPLRAIEIKDCNYQNISFSLLLIKSSKSR